MQCNGKSRDEKARSYKQIKKLNFNSAVMKNAILFTIILLSWLLFVMQTWRRSLLVETHNFYMLCKNLISCGNHNSFFYTWFSRCSHFLWINSSTCEWSTKFFTPGSGLNTDSLFGPVLGTRISPGGNHLVYRIHCPPSVLVTILIFNSWWVFKNLLLSPKLKKILCKIFPSL